MSGPPKLASSIDLLGPHTEPLLALISGASAPPDKHPGADNMGSHADADPTQAVDGLVRAIRDLTSDPNYKLVADVFSEFLFLKDHNHRLSMSHRETMEEYRKFRNELEAAKEKLDKEKKDLEGTIHEKLQEILQLTAVKTNLEVDLHQTQTTLEKERKSATEAAEAAVKQASDAADAAAKQLADLQATKDTELADLEASKKAELADLQALKETELANLQALKETELADLQALKETQLADLTTLKDGEIADLTAVKNGEISELEAAKAAVEEAKRAAEEAAATAADVARQEIEVLTVAKTGLEEVKASNEAEIATLKENITSLEEAKAGLEGVKASNETEIATLKENIATLEDEKKKVEEALAAANEEIAALQATVAQKNNEIESLQESLRAAEEQIGSLQQTVEDKNAKIDDLHGKLTAEGARADSAIAHGEDLQARLDDTEQTLHLTSGKLADLEQYRVPLHHDNEDIYVTVLDKIWTNIVTLVEGTFRPNIDEQILADPSCWANLRNSPYLKHATSLQIPLPQSNSPAAKGMRISAVLAVLSRALHRYLFRPVYLLDEEDEPLVKFLRQLEDEDPTREAHMRATLLAMMPERQLEEGARRVKKVVREVSWLVQHLLSALQFEAFYSGLEAACRLACEQWMRIQMAGMKIEPYFGPPYDDFDWQVLELPEFGEEDGMDETATMGMGMHSENGDERSVSADGPLETVEATEFNGADRPDGSVSGSADAFVDPATQTQAQEEDAASSGGLEPQHDLNEHSIDDDDDEHELEIDPEEILLVVWPSMCSVENGDLMSITQGLVISKEQARPALEEVRSRSRMAARPGSRRARTMSMPGQSRAGSPRGKSTAFLATAAAQQQIAAAATAEGSEGGAMDS